MRLGRLGRSAVEFRRAYLRMGQKLTLEERPLLAQSGHWLTLTDGGGFDVVKKTKDINCLGVPREFRTLRTSALMIGLGVAGK